jgi:hypothetical protein
MQIYDVYRENGTLELVAVIYAADLDEAKEKARILGYGKEYRVEEAEED